MTTIQTTGAVITDANFVGVVGPLEIDIYTPTGGRFFEAAYLSATTVTAGHDLIVRVHSFPSPYAGFSGGVGNDIFIFDNGGSPSVHGGLGRDLAYYPYTIPLNLGDGFENYLLPVSLNDLNVT